jgi:excisionase family DNA binding protein
MRHYYSELGMVVRMPLSVGQAAAKLGVSERRMRALIYAGSVHAERVGSQWTVDEAALARYSPNVARPLSPRNAWGLLELSAGLRPALSPSELSRARKRLSALGNSRSPEQLLRSWFAQRSERRVYRASHLDISDLRDDGRLLVSGASHAESGISAGDLAEGYVAAPDQAALVAEYLLTEGTDDRGNVVLHVFDPDQVAAERLAGLLEGQGLLLAVDLAEHRSPREERRAAQLVAAAFA